MPGLRKVTLGKLWLSAGIASLLAVGVPAAAMAHTGTDHAAARHASTGRAVREPAGFHLNSCTGTVFSNTTLQNVTSGDYMAKSNVDDSLVLYTHTDERFDGYRDADGHLIIYLCDTSDVLTDNPAAKCMTGYRACAYVEPYNDDPDQWWNRYVHSNIWYVQCVAPKTGDWVLTDPHGTNAEGTHVTLTPLKNNFTNEEWRVSS